MRFAAVTAVGALLSMACGGGNSTTTTGAPLKIGVVMSVTGSAASNGIPIANGSLLAADQINKAGGVTVGNEKRKIEITVYDDAGTAETGLAAITRMVEQDNTHLMAGIVASTVGEGLLPYVKRQGDANLLVVVDGATSAKLTNETTNVFRMQAGIPSYLLSNAAYQVKQGWKKVALVTDILNPAQVAGTPGLLDYYNNKGVNVVVNIETKRGQGDFTSVIAKIKPFNPDVVFVRTFTDDELLFVKQAREQGWNVPITATVTTSPTAIGKSVPAAAMTNVFEIVPPTVASLINDGNARAKALSDAYQAKFNVPPDNLTLQGYEAIQVLAAGVSAAGSDKPIKVNAALKTLKPYPGLLFPIDTSGGTVFDKTRNVSVKFVVYQWTNGKIEQKGSIAP
jgi:branched-chain amino acid transport system substrate-binding protein